MYAVIIALNGNTSVLYAVALTLYANTSTLHADTSTLHDDTFLL